MRYINFNRTKNYVYNILKYLLVHIAAISFGAIKSFNVILLLYIGIAICLHNYIMFWLYWKWIQRVCRECVGRMHLQIVGKILFRVVTNWYFFMVFQRLLSLRSNVNNRGILDVCMCVCMIYVYFGITVLITYIAAFCFALTNTTCQ